MVKINYIIATYAGYCKRGDSFVTMSEILRFHLIQLHKIHHNLSKITIMKAECIGKKIEGYYDIQDIVDKWSKTSTQEKLMTFLNKNDSELYLDKFL